MKTKVHLVLFNIDSNKYALHLNSVEQIIHAVYITQLPKSPEIIAGVINLQGVIIPIVDLRKIFGLKAKELHPDDQIIIAISETRKIALVVDSVENILKISSKNIIRNTTVLPKLPYVKGLIALKDGMILINDINEFLSLEEEEVLEEILSEKN